VGYARAASLAPALALCVHACGGSGGGSTSASTDAGGPGTPGPAVDAGPAEDVFGTDAGTDDGAAARGGPPDGGAASCSPDPLRTGLTAQQTGVSVDAFDCRAAGRTARPTCRRPAGQRRSSTRTLTSNYGSTKSCAVYNTSYDDAVIMAYGPYASAAGYAAHAY
jgi:hypothetical protein